MSLWDVMVSIFWFFVLFARIWLLIDPGRHLPRPQAVRLGKAGWTLFLIVLPWLGALTCLIVRGGAMNERARAQAQRNEERSRQYIQEVAAASPVNTADELTNGRPARSGCALRRGLRKTKTKVLS